MNVKYVLAWLDEPGEFRQEQISYDFVADSILPCNE
jgi:hypothetical protein